MGFAKWDGYLGIGRIWTKPRRTKPREILDGKESGVTEGIEIYEILEKEMRLEKKWEEGQMNERRGVTSAIYVRVSRRRIYVGMIHS